MIRIWGQPEILDLHKESALMFGCKFTITFHTYSDSDEALLKLLQEALPGRTIVCPTTGQVVLYSSNEEDKSFVSLMVQQYVVPRETMSPIELIRKLRARYGNHISEDED